MTKNSSDSNDGLTPEQIAMFKNVVRDPVLFASHVLSLDLWPRDFGGQRDSLGPRSSANRAHTRGFRSILRYVRNPRD